jgi:hypothetical protein
VLYQLSYIGLHQLSAISLQLSAKPLLRTAFITRMHCIFTAHPSLHCKQRQNRQRRNSDSRIAQCR